MYEKENRVFVSAVDCTGHGVPGAFMSSIGSEKLTEGVSIRGMGSPSELLSFLNRGVKEMLRQEEEGSRSRDGMDIALLRFDMAKKELMYAGANRPLWIIRNHELIEYRPTKASIGGLTPSETDFNEQKVGLQPGDRIYIFTDGYADQFGGPSEKKFMTSRLRELLLSIHQLPMREQEPALEKAHSEWKGELAQTDDVLVIGIGV
jgi:serine phosphatase RsbU (regulator of sigma subunit)